jgi:phosphotriesterase-related protein
MGNSARELCLFREAGGGAIVDAQPLGCGRDADILGELSEKSGIHIIASTGFHKVSYYSPGHWIYEIQKEKLALLFTEEIEHGMYAGGDTTFPEKQCGRRAGQIKSAFDTCGLNGQYTKCFEAAVIAAKSTGAALMVHIENGSVPQDVHSLADFIESKGLQPERVIFCHLDRAVRNTCLHREIACRGFNLEFDTICRPKYHATAAEISFILSFLEAGFETQLLMSLDTTKARLFSYGGSPGLDYILKRFVPVLLSKGVNRTLIELFFKTNPARIFNIK